jgi:hypothetical protein
MYIQPPPNLFCPSTRSAFLLPLIANDISGPAGLQNDDHNQPYFWGIATTTVAYLVVRLCTLAGSPMFANPWAGL